MPRDLLMMRQHWVWYLLGALTQESVEHMHIFGAIMYAIAHVTSSFRNLYRIITQLIHHVINTKTAEDLIKIQNIGVITWLQTLSK